MASKRTARAARARKPAPTEIEPTGREVSSVPAPEAPADEVAQFLSSLGGKTAQLYLHRRSDAGRFAYLAMLPSDGFTLQLVQQRYGGGVYKVTIMKGSGNFGGSKVFEIAGAPRDPAQAGETGTAAMLQEVLRELRDRSAPAALNPVELMVQMQQAAATQMTNMVALITTLQKAPAAVAPAAPALHDQVGILRDLLELAPQMLSGGVERESSLDKYLPSVLDLLRGIKERFAPAAPGDPAAAPAATPTAGDGAVNPLWQQLAPHIPRLVNLARTNSDPVLWADVVREQAPPAVRALERMAESTSADAVLDEFIAQFPAAQPYRAWFAGLVGELLEPGGIEDGEVIEDSTN